MSEPIKDITPEGHNMTGGDIAKVLAPIMGVEAEDIERVVIVAYVPNKGGIAFGGTESAAEMGLFLSVALDVLADGIAEQITQDVLGLFADGVEHDLRKTTEVRLPQAKISPDLN